MASMTGRERIAAAYRGEPVDYAPIWLREGFNIGEPYPEPDDFTQAWMWDPIYREMFEFIEPHIDGIGSWGCGGWGNRFLMIPPQYIHVETTQISPTVRRQVGTIDTPRGPLTYIDDLHQNHKTWWHKKSAVESLDDLIKLSEVPFAVSRDDLTPFLDGFAKADAQMGDRGMVRTGFSSPIVCISHVMDFTLFLELTLSENKLFHELLAELSDRGCQIIDALLEGRAPDTIVNIGGSEQCTPPMMGPRGYDEFVTPYDGPMVARLKQHGVITTCHCHGKVGVGALQAMIEMGFDGTDPVEPPPAGDVTYAQAREIADGKITLIGNIEWDELTFAEPEIIRQRVREILDMGHDRLILGTSAGPVSPMDQRTANNYRAMVETALGYR